MIPGHFRRIGLVVALFLAVIAALSGCGEAPPDEALLRAQLEMMASALEEEDLAAFLEPVAEDFSAGELNKRQIRWLLRRQWSLYEQVGVQLADVVVDVQDQFDPPRATIQFQALTTGGDWLPQAAGWYTVTTGWRRDEGDWRMISASWERKI
ncbi:MAG: nuclear transport factor 2 family protein [Wenzhouxiangellaceae bacterium]